LINKGKSLRYFVETFGCQMNVNDSEKIAGLLEADGYERGASAAEADFVFVNTCAVREKAADKLFHALGRLRPLKAKNPDLLIGVGGCVAQLHGAAVLERSPHIDVLLGTHNFGGLLEAVREARASGGRVVDLDRKADPFTVPDAVTAHSSPVRAYVTVMEGCNHVCSFCVVPRTRGPEVNRPPEQIVAEVAALVGRGYREVMLLGQTVNAYRWEGVDFAALLEQVAAVPGLERLRFTTSHPEHVTPRLAEALGGIDKVCPYLHLPVQSGSSRILGAMRRGYDREAYLDTVTLLRRHVPKLALSSDVIVGYPGETEEEFADTLSLVESVGYDGLFVFTYSPRPGTAAVRLEDDVPEEEKRRRLHVLNGWQQRFQADRNAGLVGTRQSVLVDAVGDEGRISGRTPQFRIVHLDGGPDLVGRIVDVEIVGSGPNALRGQLCQQTIH
jgi:tRNA-2-methylthio-N6-dimethylallyladenosine synthase